MEWVIFGFVALMVIGGISRENTRTKADQAIIKMARSMEVDATPAATQAPSPVKKSGSLGLVTAWVTVLLVSFTIIGLATSPPQTAQKDSTGSSSVAAAVNPPSAPAGKPAPAPASKPKPKDEITVVQDHCYQAYLGLTSDEAFMHATPVVREKVVDCMGYYFDHNKHYPTESQLSAYSAVQDRDYVQHLSPKEKRRRELEALGEAICHGDETCVSHGVEANEAIDDAEAKLSRGTE